jgi:hypothetical protein
LVDFHDIWWAGDAIKEDLDAATFNLIASTILKWFRFKAGRCKHYLHTSTFPHSGFGLFSIVGFPW